MASALRRRRTAVLGGAAALSVLPAGGGGARRPLGGAAAALEGGGVSLREAVEGARGVRAAAGALLAGGPPPGPEEGERLVRVLRECLPAVGAEAAQTPQDWRLRARAGSLDGLVGAFALLDRAADGASLEGRNQTISIADIERLERLEAATEEAVEALEQGVRAFGEGDGREGERRIRTAADRIDFIIEGLPPDLRR